MTEPNTTLGRYFIQAELGKGGFATVFRALDTSLNREVALKILHPQLLADRTFVDRFRKEARTLASLRHAHIVTIYEVSEAEGRVFIAMELAHGTSLAQAIADRKHLPWTETLAILKPVTEALDYAHGQGVIHRDLKPANILLDSERGPLLTDFGFARLMGDSSMSVSLTGGILGTPAYIAPEVWELDMATGAADIYALGCITYEMVTGEVLFSGKTPMQSMRAHDRGPQFKFAWPDHAPQGIDQVLQMALARKPEVRYPSASTLWHALNDLEASAQAAREQAERQAIADQWKAEVNAAMADQEWSAAKMAVGRWLAITPEDAQAIAARSEIEKQIEQEARKASRMQGAEAAAAKAKQEAEDRERVAQAAMAAEAARKMGEERQRLAAEKKKQEAAQAAAEAKAKQAAEEQKRQRQATLAAQEKAKRTAEGKARRDAEAAAVATQSRRDTEEKVKREAQERERQTVAEKAQLAKAEQAQQVAVSNAAQQESSAKAKTSPWLFVVGALAVVVIIAMMASGSGRPATVVEPPTQAPTAAVAASTQVPNLGPVYAQVNILAQADWQDTGVIVSAGQSVRITVESGSWSPCALNGCPYIGAEGVTSSSPNGSDNIIIGCYHGALIAQISAETFYCVGTGTTIQAESTGNLRLRINDNRTSDNDGMVQVSIQMPTPVIEAPTNAPVVSEPSATVMATRTSVPTLTMTAKPTIRRATPQNTATVPPRVQRTSTMPPPKLDIPTATPFTLCPNGYFWNPVMNRCQSTDGNPNSPPPYP